MAEEGIVRAVATQLADIDETVVRKVLTAWARVTGGDPVGTVLEDPATGSIAVRVSLYGELLWHITGLDGSTNNDQAPTLPGWTVLKAAS